MADAMLDEFEQTIEISFQGCEWGRRSCMGGPGRREIRVHRRWAAR